MTASDAANEQPLVPEGHPDHTLRRGRGGRLISALLATGGYALLAGGVLLLPFGLSPYAVQNDVYLGNYFLAPLFVVAGACSVLVGLLRLERSRAQGADARGHRLRLLAQALLLAVTGAAAVVVATFVVGGRYSSVGPNAPTWPPYLGLPLLGVIIGIGLVVAAVAWVWQWKPAAPTDRANTR